MMLTVVYISMAPTALIRHHSQERGNTMEDFNCWHVHAYTGIGIGADDRLGAAAPA